jgi:hypothetical protein
MGLLKKGWQRWKKFGHTLADFQSRLILSVIYGVVIAPVGLVYRLFNDPLALKNPTTFSPFNQNATAIDHVKNQF